MGYREDVPQLMAASDAFLLPSYREGTPRVITEALASGLPVLSTDIAGIPEQVNHKETGYLVEPGDINAIESNIRKLQEADNRRQFEERAGESIERFSIEAAAEKSQELYRELVNQITR
jgi:glycosyltransferase involved in cell wall biosynthesis